MVRRMVEVSALVCILCLAAIGLEVGCAPDQRGPLSVSPSQLPITARTIDLSTTSAATRLANGDIRLEFSLVASGTESVVISQVSVTGVPTDAYELSWTSGLVSPEKPQPVTLRLSGAVPKPFAVTVELVGNHTGGRDTATWHFGNGQ